MHYKTLSSHIPYKPYITCAENRNERRIREAMFQRWYACEILRSNSMVISNCVFSGTGCEPYSSVLVNLAFYPLRDDWMSISFQAERLYKTWRR